VFFKNFCGDNHDKNRRNKMKNNNIGRIITLKNAGLFMGKEILSFELPVKFLVIGEEKENYRLAPLYHGNIDAPEDYNEFTEFCPFIHFEELGLEIKALSIQTNCEVQVKKSFVQFYTDIQFNLTNLLPVVESNLKKRGPVPEKVAAILEVVPKIVETNKKVEEIKNPG